MLSNSDIKIGLRVRCILNTINRYGEIGTIIGFYHYKPIMNILIKWDDGCKLFTNWEDGSYFELYTDSVSSESYNPFSLITYLQEAPCKVCGRNNDIGVRKCWNCETLI